jgi:hypothetical protein
MVDVKHGNNLLYLPLDKIIGNDASRVQLPNIQAPSSQGTRNILDDVSRSRNELRTRESR